MLEHLAAATHHFLFQLERRNAESQQTADFRIAVEHHRLNPVSCQHVGAGKPRGPGADHGDTLVGFDHVGEIGSPAEAKRLVGDVFLHRAYGDRAEAVV